jgi:hypothetical protein
MVTSCCNSTMPEVFSPELKYTTSPSGGHTNTTSNYVLPAAVNSLEPTTKRRKASGKQQGEVGGTQSGKSHAVQTVHLQRSYIHNTLQLPGLWARRQMANFESDNGPNPSVARSTLCLSTRQYQSRTFLHPAIPYVLVPLLALQLLYQCLDLLGRVQPKLLCSLPPAQVCGWDGGDDSTRGRMNNAAVTTQQWPNREGIQGTVSTGGLDDDCRMAMQNMWHSFLASRASQALLLRFPHQDQYPHACLCI